MVRGVADMLMAEYHQADVWHPSAEASAASNTGEEIHTYTITHTHTDAERGVHVRHTHRHHKQAT